MQKIKKLLTTTLVFGMIMTIGSFIVPIYNAEAAPVTVLDTLEPKNTTSTVFGFSAFGPYFLAQAFTTNDTGGTISSIIVQDDY